MATQKNMNPLKKIDYTKLDFETIVADVVSVIKSHPDYYDKWQDFLESNAGQMFLDVFGYIGQKIILRADLIANELFLPTAQDPKSVVNILKLIGYNLSPPSSAKVPITISSEETFSGDVYIQAGTKFEGKGLDGKNLIFEIMNEENDYTTPIVMNGSLGQVVANAWEGQTVVGTIEVDKKEEFTFNLPSYPVIKGSILLELYDGSNYDVLEEITSLAIAGEDTRLPRYTVSYDENYNVKISFGKKGFGGVFENVIDGLTTQTLKYTYRVGGGVNGNVTIGAINGTKNIFLGSGSAVPTLTISYINQTSGIGGAEGQTIEEAKKIAPLTIKTIGRTTTAQDYTTILQEQKTIPLYDSNIQTPFENPDVVPYLFSYIYISPKRDWDLFVKEDPNEDPLTNYKKIPIAKTAETIENYNKRFLIRLNNFLNLDGVSNAIPLTNDPEYGFCNSGGLIYPRDYGNGEDLAYEDGTEARELYKYLYSKKILAIENVFRISNFIPFNITGDLYYKDGFEPISLVANINNALLEKFSIENSKFENTIKVSEIYNIIQNFDGVSHFNMTFPTQDLIAKPSEIYFILPTKIVNLLDESSQPSFKNILNINRV